MTQEIEFKDKLQHDVKISVETQTLLLLIAALGLSAWIFKRKK